MKKIVSINQDGNLVITIILSCKEVMQAIEQLYDPMQGWPEAPMWDEFDSEDESDMLTDDEIDELISNG